MNCRVSLPATCSLTNHRSHRDIPRRLFVGTLLEIYRDVPGSPTVFWKPNPDNADVYADLKNTLDQLPRLLVTVVKQYCGANRGPSAELSSQRRGSSLVQSFVAQLRCLSSRHQPDRPSPDSVTDVKDELYFVASLPTEDVDFSLFRGMGHALNSLENDLSELSEMLQSERNRPSDVASVVYDCRRILRKTNLVRWVICVYLYTCLPLLNYAWSSQENLRDHVHYCVQTNLDRLGQLDCLVHPFWNHRAIDSALNNRRLQ